MTADPRRIIVTESCCDACDVHTVRVHHQNLPELRVEAVSAERAAEHLVNRLVSAHDTTDDPFHREAVQHALADARAFLGREGPAHPGRNASPPKQH